MDSATETQVKSVNVLVSSKNEFAETKSLPHVLSVCQDIISDLPQKDNRVGEHSLAFLKEKRSQYKTLRSLYSLERSGKRLPKLKVAKLEEAGLSTTNIPEDTAIISANLFDALFLTYKYIYETDPKQVVNPTETKSLEYVTLGARSNISFTDFFIDLHERFNLEEGGLEKIFETIFDDSNLSIDLKRRGLLGFREGILAAVKAYLRLKRLKPNFDIKTPDVVLDRDHGIDLVAVSKNGEETSYYQIKSVRGSGFEIKDVTKSPQMEALRKELVLASGKKSRRDLRSLGNIFSYVSRLRRVGEKASAYWVQVPV